MKTKLMGLIAAAALLWPQFPASAATTCTPGFPCEIDVTYSGIIASGYNAPITVDNENIPPNVGLLGTVGSLAGDSATITLDFNLAQGTYTNGSNSSSLMNLGPAIAQASILIYNGGILVGGESLGSTGGAAVDAASIGTTNQSLSQILPQYGETSSIIASASDPLIPSSILQDFSLDDVPLFASFSLAGTDCAVECYDAYGNITFGDMSVELVNPTPLPTALPLFASGLGALSLLGWRRRRRRRVSAVGIATA